MLIIVTSARNERLKRFVAFHCVEAPITINGCLNNNNNISIAIIIVTNNNNKNVYYFYFFHQQ